ncbi:hypothetical protein J2768_002830 [Agrobacterium tumefaciens]|uniref:hypothetical protein n=1 Tax=Agrobacterium tumefaciens TaxID=358 RepID=UPI001AE36E7B|nr:hypothetical protein [Agrobacterium tumefaciens]MBP2540393.1 hypothetical protein [Agrobacterium tumefaciens]MDP9788698.1 hypothetical protein [Agrobacterium tumefaciens]
MQPLLDHEDFTKSRKALLASSSFLLLAQHVSTSGGADTISIMSLRISHEALIGLGCLSVLYFAFVFIFRSLEHSTSLRDDLEETLLPKVAGREAEYRNAIETYARAEQAHFDPLEADEHERSDRLAALRQNKVRAQILYLKAKNRIERRLRLRMALFYLVDLLPPIILTAWVLSRLNPLETMSAFLVPSRSLN